MATTASTTLPAATTHNSETELDFDATFWRLLEAANLVQRLREVDAEPGIRIEAQRKLLSARVDASRARSHRG